LPRPMWKTARPRLSPQRLFRARPSTHRFPPSRRPKHPRSCETAHSPALGSHRRIHGFARYSVLPSPGAASH
ncbi:MAG: hypothetical protein ACK55Z_08140, partial [bacterium]